MPDTPNIDDLRIVDAHHHLWDLDRNYYPWLVDQITERVCGEYSAIRRNYRLGEFRDDIGDLDVIKSVHIQAEWDPADHAGETAWLQRVADGPGSNGMPHAIVAYADLAAADLDEVLEGHGAHRNIRGIRQILHGAYVDPTRPGRSLFLDPRWRAGLKRLTRYGLSFDLQVFFQQMEEAYDLCREVPDLQFILCHAGQPRQRDAESLEGWRTGLARLAEAPNLAVKISGLGMFDRTWTADSLRPYVLHTIDTFGPDRVMFGSNFPVDGMMSSYRRLWQAYSDITGSFSQAERHAMFCANAEKVYRI